MVKIEKLKPMPLGGYEYFVNPELGYYPYFSVELRKRVRQKKICNVGCTGEGGIGKTYQCNDIARVMDKRFDVEDIVFSYYEFLRAVLSSKRGIPIVFDEPSYAMSKKEWYKEVTKALVKTIESFRFKGKPLFIPIINKALLEKDIRNYLLQFQIVVHDRGKATVYKLYPSQFKDRIYNYVFCQLRYGLFDNNLCNIDSCLACRKLNPKDTSLRCMIFRAKYERKKIKTQETRYEDELSKQELKQSANLSLDEVEKRVIEHFDKYYDPDKNKIDVNLLYVVLKRSCNIEIGHSKLYKLSAQIEFDHPKLFIEPPEISRDNIERA